MGARYRLLSTGDTRSLRLVSTRLRVAGLLAATLSVGHVTAARPTEDPFDRALRHVGLTKKEARFDYDAMGKFGRAEFRLPYWRAFHGDPFGVPTKAKAMASSLRPIVRRLAPLVRIGAARLDELDRRQLDHDPLAEAAKQANEPGALVRAIAFVSKKSGQPLNRREQTALRREADSVPPAIANAAALLLYASMRAYDWRQRAFEKAARLYDLQELFSRVLASIDSEGLDPDLYRLMHLVDLEALFAGAEVLALAVDRVLPALSKFDSDARFHFRWETPLGQVEINGASDDVYPAGVKRLLTIDTGGDDRYESGGATTAADNPVSVLIDMRGNDIYDADKSAPSFGAGILGYGMLVDLGGDDTYVGSDFSQGAGAFGVGCLLDIAGDDHYTARAHSQGAGQFGIGILSDVAGNDHYEGLLGVQGFGYTKGFGLLVDSAGDDQYVANDTRIEFPAAQTPQHNTSCAQGCGMGRRPEESNGHSLAGGVGILLDESGDDEYSAGVFAQGAGYWYGLGILFDEQGNDRYRGVWYVQGSAAHFAVGILIDGAGNDEYNASMNMAQGAGHDFSLGWLLDESGNDHYDAPTLSLGAGNANGIGIFWDKAGDDTYRTKGGVTIGNASYEPVGLRSSLLCLGIFVDGAGNDDYPANVPQAGNNRVWTRAPSKGEPAGTLTRGVGFDE